MTSELRPIRQQLHYNELLLAEQSQTERLLIALEQLTKVLNQNDHSRNKDTNMPTANESNNHHSDINASETNSSSIPDDGSLTTDTTINHLLSRLHSAETRILELETQYYVKEQNLRKSYQFQLPLTKDIVDNIGNQYPIESDKGEGKDEDPSWSNHFKWKKDVIVTPAAANINTTSSASHNLVTIQNKRQKTE